MKCESRWFNYTDNIFLNILSTTSCVDLGYSAFWEQQLQGKKMLSMKVWHAAARHQATLLPIRSSHFWSFVSIWYVTKLSSVQFPLHSPQRTYKWYLCLFPRTRRRNLSDAGNNFNYECAVLWLSKRETKVDGKFNVFERKPRNMSTYHNVHCKSLKQYVYCVHIHT
jgi:hypothetical protein